jgi:hypothetical protein
LVANAFSAHLTNYLWRNAFTTALTLLLPQDSVKRFGLIEGLNEMSEGISKFEVTSDYGTSRLNPHHATISRTMGWGIRTHLAALEAANHTTAIFLPTSPSKLR